MSLEQTKIWTTSLVNGTLVLDYTYGLREISLVMTAGAGTVTGNAITINGQISTPIPLTINQALTINTGTSGSLIGYLEITTTGTVLIIAR